jgi:hypothetical protein
MSITLKQAAKLINNTWKKNAIAMHKEGAASMGHEYGKDTPIDSGKATANWHGSVNTINTSSKEEFDKSITADQTKSAILNDLSSLKYKDTAYVQNAVEGDTGDGYIIKLERGGSKQAPHGMFDINNNQAQKIFDRARKKL